MGDGLGGSRAASGTDQAQPGPRKAPRDAAGMPLRAWSGAWRRIMAGEPPERVSASWPAFGRLVDVDGQAFREVTFVTDAPSSSGPGAIVLNGVTDAHRADLSGALLDEVPGGALRVIDYLLPDELVLGYGFVGAPWLDPAAGATWEGWFRIQDALVPDARNPRRLPTQFGRMASVLVGPAGRVHPIWEAGVAGESVAGESVAEESVVEESVTGESVTGESVAGESGDLLREAASAEELPLGGGFEGRTAVVLPWGRPGEVVLLFDGEEWERIGIRPALAPGSGSDTGSGSGSGSGSGFGPDAGSGAVVLVPSGTVDERWAVLPHPERAAALAEAVLDALADRRGRRPDPARTIVAGQSFGGLAAAAVVALRPDLALTAVVQSGTFEFAADRPPEDWAAGSGDLLVRLAASVGTGALRGRRFVVQSGTEEAGATELATAFAEVASAAGASVTARVYAGGHDYASWRTALFDALADL